MSIKVEIAPGELIDKITILEIKLERITDAAKLANVRIEYDILIDVLKREVKDSPELATLTGELKAINGRLWTIEDDIRDLERALDFGPGFVALARSVYRTNDERAVTKRKVNALLKSVIIEEKSYAAY
jgi:Family of unknown function (DUF6165)